MTQIGNNIYYNSSNEQDNDKDIFHYSIEGDAEIDDTTDAVNGEPINSNLGILLMSTKEKYVHRLKKME